jgi:hypothetical protein
MKAIVAVRRIRVRGRNGLMRSGGRIKMPKYLVSWTEEDWYNITIEADSPRAALDMFYDREYDMEDIIHTGTELQDSVTVEAV